MKMNYQAFKELRDKYNSITLEELKKAKDYRKQIKSTQHILNLITGFGSTKTCTLCQKAETLDVDEDNNFNKCHYCLWAFNDFPDYDRNDYYDCDVVTDWEPLFMDMFCIRDNYKELKREQIDKIFTALQKRVILMDQIIKIYKDKYENEL